MAGGLTLLTPLNFISSIRSIKKVLWFENIITVLRCGTFEETKEVNTGQ
jgi:hypothetical protein